MLNLKSITVKVALVKSLITATLFFSIFTSALYRLNATNVLYEKVKVELVYSYINKHAYNSGAYKKAFSTKYNSCLVYISGKFEFFSLLYFNRLEKIKFDQNLECLHLITKPKWLIKLKIIPQNSSEDFYHSLIG
jgi:hypothetical protein